MWTASTILSTLAATLGTAPIVVYYFCGINPLCFHSQPRYHTSSRSGCNGASPLSVWSLPQGHHLLVLAGHLAGTNIAVLRAFDFGYLYPVIRPDLADALLYYALVIAVLHVHRKPVAALLCLVIVPLAVVQV